MRQSHPHILGDKPWFIPRFERKLFPAERSVTLLLSDHVNLPNSRCDLQLLESGKISDNRQLLIHFYVSNSHGIIESSLNCYSVRFIKARFERRSARVPNLLIAKDRRLN